MSIYIEKFAHRLTFDPIPHEYTFDGVPCVGVTTLLGCLEKPFDSVYHGTRVAKREGITLQEVLAKWKKTADDANFRGTGIHRWVECLLLGIPYDFEYEVPRADKLAIDSALTYILKDLRIEPEGLEVQMGDSDYGICGTCDFVGRRRNGKRVIIDWKSNAGKDFLKYDPYAEPLKGGLFHLRSDKQTIYGLQLFTYDHILTKNIEGFEADEHFIVHFNGTDRFIRVDVDDHRKSASLLLKNLQKGKLDLLLKEQKARKDAENDHS